MSVSHRITAATNRANVDRSQFRKKYLRPFCRVLVSPFVGSRCRAATYAVIRPSSADHTLGRTVHANFIAIHNQSDLQRLRSDVRPFLEAVPGVRQWDVETDAPERPLTVTGENLRPEEILAALEKAGYRGALRDTTPRQVAHREQDSSVSVVADSSSGITYYPLLLLVMFLIGVVLMVNFGWVRSIKCEHAELHGSVFRSIAFFKLLDLRGFADSYRGYDVVARAIPAYGLCLSICGAWSGGRLHHRDCPYGCESDNTCGHGGQQHWVLQSVLQKRRIRCACLGTVFYLPMSTVTVVEDG